VSHENKPQLSLWLVFADFSILDAPANFLQTNAAPTACMGSPTQACDDVATQTTQWWAKQGCGRPNGLALGPTVTQQHETRDDSPKHPTPAVSTMPATHRRHVQPINDAGSPSMTQAAHRRRRQSVDDAHLY